jgi:SAM-dependent methyltransferase
MESYRGRAIGCAPGTHAALVDLVLRHDVPRGSVLDLGTHAGALLLRLNDAGFHELWGADLDGTRFDVPGATFRILDLNTHFAPSVGRSFDLVTATDLVEHLDSPRAFFAEVASLLNEDGYLALSVPNVAFFEGRLKFLLAGELWGFGEQNYRDQRHISPMTRSQLVLCMREIGFDVVEVRFAGDFATPLRRALTAVFWAPLRAFGGPSVFGESLVVLARRVAPDPALRDPTHYRDRWRGVPDQIGIE